MVEPELELRLLDSRAQAFFYCLYPMRACDPEENNDGPHVEHILTSGGSFAKCLACIIYFHSQDDDGHGSVIILILLMRN